MLHISNTIITVIWLFVLTPIAIEHVNSIIVICIDVCVARVETPEKLVVCMLFFMSSIPEWCHLLMMLSCSYPWGDNLHLLPDKKSSFFKVMMTLASA